MAVEVKDTRFDEFLEFPCAFNFKVVGLAHDDLVPQVIATLQRHAEASDYSPSVKPSSTPGKPISYRLNAALRWVCLPPCVRPLLR